MHACRSTLEDPTSGRDGTIFENGDVLPRFYPIDAVVLEFRRDRFIELLRRQEDWAHAAILDDLKVESDRMRSDLLAPRPRESPRATLQLTASAPTRYAMRVNAPRYTLIVSSIPWWPGWKVERNGKRVDPIRVNGAFLGFAVPAGVSDVRVGYSPASFWVGVWVAGMAVALLVVLRKKLKIEN